MKVATPADVQHSVALTSDVTLSPCSLPALLAPPSVNVRRDWRTSDVTLSPCLLLLNSKPSFAFAIVMATNNNLGYFLYNTIYQHMTYQ
jgi:hypothetical protein